MTGVKQIRPELVLWAVAITAITFLANCSMLTTSSDSGPLRLHPINPRYFVDGTGQCIYLTGSHTWYLIHYTSQAPDNSVARFEAYLDWAQAFGHNFIRLWTGWSYRPPDIWLRTGTHPAYADGLPEFDMTAFDPDYVALLHDRVNRIQKRGMYCSVMLLGSAVGFHKPASWRQSSWHPWNNLNPELDRAFDVSDGRTFFTTDPQALEIQRMLVRRIIDALNGFDNLLWEIANEPGQASADWYLAMVDYVKAYESGKPKQHPVGMTGGFDLGPVMLTGNADWVSPDWAAYRHGGPPSDGAKVIIADTDHIKPFPYPRTEHLEEIRQWVWKTFLRGNHPIFMDAYDTDLATGGRGPIDPALDDIRRSMGHTLSYAHKINLAHMQPTDDPDICSSRYCLYQPGREYLAYQPRAEPMTVLLPSGDYVAETFDPVDQSMEFNSFAGWPGGPRTFFKPAHVNGDWVLHLKRGFGSGS